MDKDQNQRLSIGILNDHFESYLNFFGESMKKVRKKVIVCNLKNMKSSADRKSLRSDAGII